MKKWALVFALVVLAATAQAGVPFQPTVNPLVPVQNSPLQSSVVRGNFQSTYNDFVNLASLIPGTITTSLTVGNTAIASGNNTRVLFDNNGILGEYVITGTGNVVMSAAPTFTGTITAAGLTLSNTLTTNITGSTQCLHVNSAGVVSGTGSDCGAGSGGLVVGTTTVTGGVTGRVLYDNGGVVGEYAITGTGNNVMSASPTLTGTITAAALSLSSTLTTNVTGSTQCLHVNSSGVVSGTGADCGSGSSGIAIGTTVVSGGTTTRVLFDNAGVAGEYVITGTGNVVMSASPTLSGTVAGTYTLGGTPSIAYTALTGMGTGVSTFLGTPSSANLAAAVTDETGTGALVFAGSPTFTGTITAAAETLSGTLTTNLTGGGIQCVHVSNTGVLSGTGSDCGSGGGGVTGSGVNNYLTNWTGTTTIGTSLITTNASSFLGVGTTTPLASIDDSKNTDAIAVPIGTNGTRPGTPITGETRYNSTANTKGWLESWSALGTAAWVVLQPLVGGGLETTNSASANSTALQAQENSLISLGTSSLATDWGIPGISIPRGSYSLGAGINMVPWIKLQTSGTVKFDASSNSATTVTTNATTANTSPTLHFASGGTNCKPGQYLLDTTTPAHITVGTQVAYTTVPTATTITMTQNAASTVASGDVISCSYVAFDITNDQVPSGSFTTYENFANASPTFDTNNGSLVVIGPGSATNSIGIKMGSELASPGTDNNVRDLHFGPVALYNFNTGIELLANSMYINHFDQGGHISGVINGIATSQGNPNNNAGENIHFAGGWVIDGATNAFNYDTPNIDTVADGISVDFDTHAFTSTANDGYAKHEVTNSHLEELTDIVNCSSSNIGNLEYILHDNKFVENSALTKAGIIFKGACSLDLDGFYVGGYPNANNDPTRIFMTDSVITPLRMEHIFFTNFAQLTSYKLNVTSDACVTQGVNGANIATSPPSTYTTSTALGGGANAGITGTVDTGTTWNTYPCAGGKSIALTETNTTNNYTVGTDRFPVHAGQLLAGDVVFQTTKAASTATINTQFLYSSCNAAVSTTGQGFFGDTIGTDVAGANTWASMSYVNTAVVPTGICYAQFVVNVSGLAATEVVRLGGIFVTPE